ncbi:membrane-spanning 4-domains subfamily A member 7-like isoform X2 [Oryx dammah]|uniref:membrane-spanning 4-domains subfamily A member 7-like isoform X2 n=1 Tax=Oryx dammah TaxID=59534 RepID=UPI001A9B1FEA|nr:membrane-spanning 4-domains subfamily A member 7-like isoform X2 [Oryx dammah]
MPSPLKLITDRAFDAFTPKGVVISQREKPGRVYQKDDLPKGLPKEATVLGTIQILCFLVISSLGVILVYAPNSPQLSPAISTILMSGYPFLGALCAMNSLTFSAVSSVAAGVGFILLTSSLVTLRTASQQCDSGRDYLSSLPYSTYYYSIYDVKDCLLTSVGLTGVLVVMLTFTVLELLAAAHASVFWWKRSTATALHSSSRIGGTGGLESTRAHSEG